MIEFCEANQLIATNTWFKQPRRRLYTWTSPDGLHRNQIDYILIQKRWRSMIKSAKTMPGADCGTDHELLVATIQVKLKKTKKPEIENRYNLCDIPERYAVEVMNRFAALDLIDREPEELWQEVEAIVKDEAKNKIPKARKPKKSKWLTKVAIDIADKRREAKKGQAHPDEVRKLNAEFQRVVFQLTVLCCSCKCCVSAISVVYQL